MTSRGTIVMAALLAVAAGVAVAAAQGAGEDAVRTVSASTTAAGNTPTDAGGGAGSARAAASPSPSAVGGDLAAMAASLPVGGKAPQVRAASWLNSPPLTPADLRGRVVLYEFWTFGCVNCRHVQPYVKAWYDRYAADGLVVVGVHTPEFSYEKDPAVVKDYVTENGLRYPIALDPDGAVWTDFGNRYWPQFYVHDRDGNRRVVKIGEGGYATTENAIRALLGVDPGSPRAAVP